MTKPDENRTVLDEQIRYYQARAGEYDDWFLRKGRWDRGEALNHRWFVEVEQVRAALDAFKPEGRVLEIACGTGLWTELLVRYADQVTALDTAPEVMEINRARVDSSNVCYLQTDIFAWEPKQQYDVVFFGFWLSHVPAALFAPFWDLVGQALCPGGRVFFLDSAYEPTSTAKDHRLEGTEATMVSRRLNDGREFRIFKLFYKPETLTRQLADLGWDFRIAQTPAYFIYGSGSRKKDRQDMELGS